jgi:DNA-binding NarL/FixJ family response regulator
VKAIVDDHPLFRDGLATTIQDEPDLELAGAGSAGGSMNVDHEMQ